MSTMCLLLHGLSPMLLSSGVMFFTLSASVSALCLTFASDFAAASALLAAASRAASAPFWAVWASSRTFSAAA